MSSPQARRTALLAAPLAALIAGLATGGASALMFATEPAKQEAAWKFMKFITGAEGATIMVKGTGYMPPNSVPATNPAMLKDFYAEKPNHLTSLSQQPLMTAWYAFPGDNNLKIIQAINGVSDLKLEASASGGTTVLLTHDLPTALGNGEITDTVEAPSFEVIGMSGGQGGDCAANEACSTHEDCISNSCLQNVCQP